MIGDNHDWYNLNSIRSYPFEYKKYELSDKGLEFSDSFIVDCMAIVHSSESKIYLSSIHFSANILTATFYDSISNSDVFMAQCRLNDRFVSSSIISLSGIDVSGNVAFGDLTKFYHMRLSGLHKFDNKSIPLIEYCYVSVGNPAVSSIRYNTEKIIGDVDISTIGLLNTLVDTENNGVKNIVNNGVTQKVLSDESNVLFYLSDPSAIKEICPAPVTICDCPNIPIKKINNVVPNPANGEIEINIGEFVFSSVENKFILNIGSSSSGLELINTEDGIILSLEKTGEEVCEETKVIPFSDGRLPSEEFTI
jgi:hypothetical protein